MAHRQQKYKYRQKKERTHLRDLREKGPFLLTKVPIWHIFESERTPPESISSHFHRRRQHLRCSSSSVSISLPAWHHFVVTIIGVCIISVINLAFNSKRRCSRARHKRAAGTAPDVLSPWNTDRCYLGENVLWGYFFFLFFSVSCSSQFCLVLKTKRRRSVVAPFIKNYH